VRSRRLAQVGGSAALREEVRVDIVLLGPGLMGAQIGCEYALGGHRVRFVARRRSEAERRIGAAFDLARDLALAEPAQVEAARQAIRIVDDAGEIADQPDLVVESIAEDLGAKGDVLRGIAARFPHATIVSNTSSLSITAIGEAAGAPERTLGTHYWNPPLLMPLVEVIRGERTEQKRVARVMTDLQQLGKRPVAVERDVPGFVWNRLQFALLREAVWIVEQGVATTETVDAIVRDGLARRWRMTGPFQTAALGGAETFSRIAANLFPALSTATELDNLGRWLSASAADLADARERRDQELLAELRRDRDQAR
jgi:3-hydroxybutyryl-CoA dehydrogenase